MKLHDNQSQNRKNNSHIFQNKQSRRLDLVRRFASMAAHRSTHVDGDTSRNCYQSPRPKNHSFLVFFLMNFVFLFNFQTFLNVRNKIKILNATKAGNSKRNGILNEIFFYFRALVGKFLRKFNNCTCSSAQTTNQFQFQAPLDILFLFSSPSSF